MTNTVIGIREMCEEFDVTPRTLRFYESKELLSPIRQGQKRLFTKSDRGRLTLILRGKRFGFSLEEIRQLLDLYKLDDQLKTQVEEARKLATKRLAELVKQRDDLNSVIATLSSELKQCGPHNAGKRMPSVAA